MDEVDHLQTSWPGCNLKNVHSKTFMMFETIRVCLPVLYSLALRPDRKTGKGGVGTGKERLDPLMKPLATGSQES